MRNLSAVDKAAVVVLAMVVAAVAAAPWLTPFPPDDQNLAARLASPSATHWLGTDHLGRDTLSRLLDGGRFSLVVAALATVLTGLVGLVIGVLSARRKGWLDEFFTRTNDVLLALPEMVVALFIVAAMGTGFSSLLVALTVTGWTPFARLARLPMTCLHADLLKRRAWWAVRRRSSFSATSFRIWQRRCWDRRRCGSGSS